MRSTPARARAPAPTLSATAEYASEAPRIRRSRGSPSPCRRDKSFVPALSLRPRPATTRKAIKSSGPILATSPSSGTAKPPPLPARRVRQLCRCSNWHGSSSGGPAQRQGSARQRVPGVRRIRSVHFQLALNLTTVKALDLKLPTTLLARADHVAVHESESGPSRHFPALRHLALSGHSGL